MRWQTFKTHARYCGSLFSAARVMRRMIWDSVGGSGTLGDTGTPVEELLLRTLLLVSMDSACQTT